jgi:hypothetical protein
VSIEDDQRRSIQEIAGQLVPAAFFAKIGGWLKGSLPGDTSPREGGRSSLRSMPGWDKFDRTLRAKRKRYSECLREAEKLMREAAAIESWAMKTDEAAPPEPEPPDVFMCNNQPCANPLVGGQKTGLCSKCRVHQHRYGMAWPNKPAMEQAR